MRERNGARSGGSGGGAGGRADAALGRIAEELAHLGVDAPARGTLARRLAAMIPGLSPEAYSAALAGVALAHSVHRGREDALRDSLRELGELQRLLGAFGEELARLDAALQRLSEALATSKGPRLAPARPRILH